MVAGDFELFDAVALCGRLNNQLQSEVGHVCVVQVETGDAAALQQVGRDVRVHEIMRDVQCLQRVAALQHGAEMLHPAVHFAEAQVQLLQVTLPRIPIS